MANELTKYLLARGLMGEEDVPDVLFYKALHDWVYPPSPPTPPEPTDPWEKLFYHIDLGDYATAYSVGDLIPLDLGTEGAINMEIVAFDADTLAADSTKTAPVTLISKELLATERRMNPKRAGTSPNWTEGTGAIGGWEKCEARSSLISQVLPLIPANVSARLCEVTKYSNIKTPAGTTTNNSATSDKIWIPSSKEIFNTGETTGVTYSSFFPDNASRQKTFLSANETWWLRTVYSTADFCAVYNTGASDLDSSQSYRGIALGFCVGAGPAPFLTSANETFLTSDNNTFKVK